MKNLLLATAFITLAAGAANAADMPVKYAPPKPVCANFGGFYVGGQVGAARYSNHWEDRDGWAGTLGLLVGSDHARDSTNAKTGFTGGLTGGFNWQAGCTVFGFEADYSWSSIAADGLHNTPTIFQVVVPGLGPDSVAVSSSLKGYGTLRARTGIVVDNVLLYVTGGLAAAKVDRSWALSIPVVALIGGGIIGNETLAYSNTRWGWTVGAGTEWAMSGNWSLKSEFLYMGFERDERTFNSTIGAPVAILTSGTKRFESQDSIWVSRIGVNYRFGGAPVSRY